MSFTPLSEKEAGKRLDLFINFNVPIIKKGIKRIIL